MERRSTIPAELEDPEDCTVSEPGDDYLDDPTETKQQQEEKPLKDDIGKLPKEVRNLLAGGVAGMVAKSLVAPMDRIKILYQVSSAEFHLLHIPRVARNIINNEGLSALWRGNTATMLRVVPYSGVQFMIYDRCKTNFLHQHKRGRYLDFDDSSVKRRKHGLTPVESLISGMTAGTISVICTYPLDLTRAQLAVLKKHRDHHNKGFVRVLADNYTQRGFPGLFRGITPTLLGILPYSGIAFTLNEQAKREIQHLTDRDLTTVERMQCGAFAGLFAQTITYPLEITRRRMQTIGLVGNDTAFGNLGEMPGQRALDKPPSLGATVRALYLEQGIRGFFKGVSMNWMKGPVAFSISFTTFDTVQGLMESDSEKALRLPRRMTFGRGKE